MIKKFSGLLVLLLVTTLFSCSDDSEGGNTSSSSISATIDGQPWASIDGGAVANVVNVQLNDQDVLALQIVAIKADQSTVTMQFPITNLAEGTYTFSGEAAGQLSYIASLTEMNLYTTADPSGSFTIVLTEVNLEEGKITGTFSGTLYNMVGTDSIEITNGAINNVSFITSDFYSDGTMSLSKNESDAFTMDANSDDGKYIMINETSFDNSLSVTGYNAILENTFGIYGLTFPKDVEAGTYSLTDSEEFKAAFSNSEDTEYTITEGSLTILSHIGNNIVATFNYTATDGTNTAVITQGELNFTHHN